jgi:NADPH2:quinone reductase
MRAAVYDTAGPRCGELRVVDLPEPQPAPGEVRVRVAVSGVNPTDWKRRRPGVPDRPWALQVPGQDGAGMIDAVGDGVDPARIGERVWLHFAALDHAGGSAAELVCVPQRRAVALPDGIGLDVGATLGIPALTAHRCLFADGPLEGSTVLVTGGAGAVGHIAVQLARRAGAKVVATVSSEAKAVLASEAGADVVLDRHAADHLDALREAAGVGFDRVVDVDVAANLPSYVDLLREGSAVASYADMGEALTTRVQQLMTRNVVLRFVLIYGVALPALDAAVADVDALLRSGGPVQLPIQRFSLEDIATAHDVVQAGPFGRVLVDIP